MIQTMQARLTAALRLLADEITEADLDRARQMYHQSLTEYIAQLPQIQPQAPPHLTSAFDSPTYQMLSENCGNDLLGLLGFDYLARQQAQQPPM